MCVSVCDRLCRGVTLAHVLQAWFGVGLFAVLNFVVMLAEMSQLPKESFEVCVHPSRSGNTYGEH